MKKNILFIIVLTVIALTAAGCSSLGWGGFGWRNHQTDFYKTTTEILSENPNPDNGVDVRDFFSAVERKHPGAEVFGWIVPSETFVNIVITHQGRNYFLKIRADKINDSDEYTLRFGYFFEPARLSIPIPDNLMAGAREILRSKNKTESEIAEKRNSLIRQFRVEARTPIALETIEEWTDSFAGGHVSSREFKEEFEQKFRGTRVSYSPVYSNPETRRNYIYADLYLKMNNVHWTLAYLVQERPNNIYTVEQLLLPRSIEYTSMIPYIGLNLNFLEEAFLRLMRRITGIR